MWFSVSRGCYVEVEMKGKNLDYGFYVVDDMPRQAIIGADFMQRWGIKLDMKNEDFEITVDPDSLEMS